MRRRLTLAVLTALAAAGVSVAPAVAQGPPETLAAQATLGELSGPSRVVEPGHPVDYLGVSWRGTAELSVRFAVDGAWTDWVEVEDDGDPSRGRSFSELVDGRDAAAYQLAGAGRDVRAVAINTTDGRRTPVARPATAEAELLQPGVISRAAWGADESLRFSSDGTEVWPPAFFATQKLVVHHTATKNDDSDPAATVRAIYRYHAVDKGWGDIGYNFLVDAEGRLYKGRWSGPAGSRTGDTTTGETADGRGVTAAHVGGYNSGTMGIAVLGDYDKATKPSTASVQAVVDHLAWESLRHGIDPDGSGTYVNPVNGATKNVANISGHRNWASTACPGRHLYAQLPDIRSRVASITQSDAATSDSGPPTAPTELVAVAGDQRVALDWADAPDSDLAGYVVERSVNGYWTEIARPDTSSYDDTGLTNGTTYSYHVRATDPSPSEPSHATATPTAPETVSAGTVTVQTGTANAGTSDDALDAYDGATFDVDTVRQGRRHVTAWTAEFTGMAEVASLAVDLAGRATSTLARTLQVRSTDGTWRTVAQQEVSTSDVHAHWSTTDVASLVADDGTLHLRVSTSGGSSATSRTDLLTVSVTRGG